MNIKIIFNNYNTTNDNNNNKEIFHVIILNYKIDKK